MQHFQLLATGVDVAPINAELAAHPELWNQHPGRTGPGSPHHGVDDIWLRWRRPEELTSPEAYRTEHIPVFWPAWDAVPSLHPLVRHVSHMVNSVMLGGILITRIPPGGAVKPHVDKGWHPEYFDMKIYLCLESNPFCVNYTAGEAFAPRAGDLFEFSNRKTHEVRNEGTTNRSSIIMCFRSMQRDMLESGDGRG